MPFGPPVGDYYQQIYEPAIRKAGLRAVRADADIFGTGKIIDQIWDGINAAKVLVAELSFTNWDWRMPLISQWCSFRLTRMTCPLT
jgi:hypothetical protein